MIEIELEVVWKRGSQDFLGKRYSRRHLIRLDGGLEILGSSSPHVVPLPMSDPAAMDPEEAFVSAISSCHMLWFLSLAAGKGYVVDHYEDRPLGRMAKNAGGKLAVSEVTLRPAIAFSGPERPDAAAIEALHHHAHEECFIANSVTTAIRVEPRPES